MGIILMNVVIMCQILIWGTNMSLVRAQEVYEFPEDEDAVVFFSRGTASDEATYSYDMFTPDQSCVFCINGIMDTSCLNPGQRDRVLVHYIRNKTSVTVTLLLQRIDRSDRGFYILAMRENSHGDITNLVQVAYIDVLFPPGEAKCDVQDSPYTTALKELHCNATVGNDGKGNLTCFQNSFECVFKIPVSYSATHMTATFWMDIGPPVYCCSFATDVSMTHQSCRQFTYPPVDK